MKEYGIHMPTITEHPFLGEIEVFERQCEELYHKYLNTLKMDGFRACRGYKNGCISFLVHENTREDRKQYPWQISTVNQNGVPLGHRTFSSIEEVAKELAEYDGYDLQVVVEEKVTERTFDDRPVHGGQADLASIDTLKKHDTVSSLNDWKKHSTKEKRPLQKTKKGHER